MDIRRKHLHRVRIKGQDAGERPLLLRKTLHFIKDGLMSQMASIKEADAEDEGSVFG